jgi:hypothetical protein
MRQAALLAHERGHRALTRQILFRLERGQIKNPEPDVLQALAKLYEQPYPALAGRFLAKRYGIAIDARDLPDQPAGVQRESSAALRGEGIHERSAPNVATTRALHDVTAAYQTFYRAVHAVSGQLARLVSDAEPPTEIRAIGGGAPPRRRRR